MIFQYLGCNKLKYSTLNEDVKTKFPEGNNINIFIDINSMISSLYRGIRVVNNFEMNADKYVKNITKSLFDIAAHYRHYFFSRFKVSSKIYFYYSFKRPSNMTREYDMYGFSHYNKLLSPTYIALTNYIKREVDFFKTVIEYFQDIYVIDTGDLDREIFPYFITKDFQTNNSINLILSKEVKSYQVLELPRTLYIYLGKNKVILNNNDIMDFICDKSKIKNSYNLDTSFLPLIYSLTGVTSYDIEGIAKYNTMAKALKHITSNIKSKEFIFSKEVIKELFDNQEDIDKAYKNIKLLSLNYNYQMLTKSYKIMLTDQIKDNVDIETVNEINREIFDDTLMLNELAEGCLLMNEKSKKRRFFESRR